MITKFKYMKLIIFLLSIFVFTSCQHEIERPSWEIDITAPLLHTQIDINDLMIDDKVFHKKYGNGIILKKDIDKAEVDFEKCGLKKVYLKFLQIKN